MKEIIIDNIATNSMIKTSIVRELVETMEEKGLAKNLNNDYVFSQDYENIYSLTESYGKNIAHDFVEAVKTENRITILNYGNYYFD